MSGIELNFWTALFLISIFNGLFLIYLIFSSSIKNKFASSILIVILFVCIITNFDYFIISSKLFYYFPYSFGVSFGMMLLLGPLLYLYSHSIFNVEFSLKGRTAVHFIPYVLNFILNIPFLVMDKNSKINFLEIFHSQQLPVDVFSIILFSFQSLHLSAYLFITIVFLRKQSNIKNNYVVSFESRKKWLDILIICLSFFLVTVVLLLVYIIYTGVLSTISNYLFTVILSAIIFIVSYNFTFRREIIDADFVERYKSVKINENDVVNYAIKLGELMESERMFLNPELKLADVADKMGITPHQLSKLINQELGKNFSEYINSFRIKEIQKKLSDPKYNSLSILGIAMESGFNSKSSFNNAFKKITGKPPSEFKN